ncbi:MAG: hypothetical protein J6T71_05360 [Paludibacteraceae bacterium]|nr:hypothetical protein [Paludibacteraceae bacterium]
MKNKLLVSLFAVAIASFAFTSCETKSNVTDVCSDMIKESIHSAPRSLVKVDKHAMSIVEYDFCGGVDDNRLLYRTIAFGDGVFSPKKVDTLLYTYGQWGEGNTEYTLNVTPKEGEPFTLIYRGNAFITPEGRTIGGEANDNVARVEKLEKVTNCLPNTKWEGIYKGDFVLDSVFRDSIRTSFIPPMTFITDTIQVFDRMDTVSADTTCYFVIEFNRDATTFANTGHYYRKEVRSKYDKKSRTCDTLSVNVKEYDGNWFIDAFTSDSRFSIGFLSATPGVVGDPIGISKFVMNDASKPDGFLYNGATFKRLP